jgi:hypothetical protein
MHFVFEGGAVHFDYYLNSLEIRSGEKREVFEEEHFDRNQLFIDQMIYFFQKLENFDLKDTLVQIEHSQNIIRLCQ